MRVLTLFRVVAAILEPIRKAQVQMETAKQLSPEVVEAFLDAYETLEKTVANEDSFYAAVVKSGAYIVLATASDTRKEGDVLDLKVTVNVTHDGGVTAEGITDITTPLITSFYSSKKEADAALKEVLEWARGPIQAAIKMYLKWCPQIFHVVRRRNYAMFGTELDLIPFDELFEGDAGKYALPRARRAKKAAPAAAPALADDFEEDIAPPTNTFLGQAKAEWKRLMGLYKNSASSVFLSAEMKTKPHEYWMAVRKEYPSVGEVMLFWLASPVGTCGLERDFCGLTMVNRHRRRRRAKARTFSDIVLAHCHKRRLWLRLSKRVRTFLERRRSPAA